MELAKLHVLVTVTAALTGILFLTLNYLFSPQSQLWLSIEVMMLPAIYIIGNLYAEKLIMEESVVTLNIMGRKLIEYDQKYYKQVSLNERLKSRLRREHDKKKD